MDDRPWSLAGCGIPDPLARLAPFVMAVLDAATHADLQKYRLYQLTKWRGVDARVKPAHDGKERGEAKKAVFRSLQDIALAGRSLNGRRLASCIKGRQRRWAVHEKKRGASPMMPMMIR
jgi:hypothetical protein